MTRAMLLTCGVIAFLAAGALLAYVDARAATAIGTLLGIAGLGMCAVALLRGSREDGSR